jgi:ABC-2 type transport system ATP-binding protein
LSGDERSFYWQLTARQNLLFFAELYGLTGEAGRKRAQELLELFELTGVAHCPVSQLSSGMRQRLSLGRALLHQPKLLFLDEPTRALDVQAAEMIWRILIPSCAQRSKKAVVGAHLCVRLLVG